MRVGSLFSGIGGIDLGLERAGMEIAWQVEIDEWCRRVLTKHWPDVPKFGDIRECGAHNLSSVDVLAGGFPCQPVSRMGQRRGEGDRRWVWPDFARLIGELRPRYVLVENVPGLFDSGFDSVLADLHTRGYDAEWQCLPAAAFGAPHIRDRVWILAYPRCESGEVLSDGDDGHHIVLPEGNGEWPTSKWGEDRELIALVPGVDPRTPTDWWRTQSRMDRSADGLPDQMDRNKGLGNAVVPQIVTWIGERIMAVERE